MVCCFSIDLGKVIGIFFNKLDLIPTTVAPVPLAKILFLIGVESSIYFKKVGFNFFLFGCITIILWANANFSFDSICATFANGASVVKITSPTFGIPLVIQLS